MRAAGVRLGWKRYASGVGLTAAIVAGRLAMDPWWGRQQNRHLVFLPAVMLVAWLFGFGPGLLSAFISVGALAAFWMGTVGVRANAELWLFLLVSGAVCAIIRSLQRARDRADVARTAREQVLAVVAHDLRTPLTTIMVTSSALGHIVAKTDLVSVRLKVIDRAALRMEGLIRDLLDTAGLDHGNLQMTMRSEKVDALVQECVDLHAPLAQEAGIVLAAAVPDHPLTVTCDRKRILQVLANLLGNALKFTPAGGRITLRTDQSADGRFVTFTVGDTGSGIAREHLPHVFERYWNADPRGTGLGLYIARSIVHRHGGAIEARSQPGQGASVSFTVPRDAAPARPTGTGGALRRLWGARPVH